jgi:peptidyl-prolyl cis-trans isomerase D
MIKIIFIIIVIVFVFWGVGNFQEGSSDRVALVNGDAITLESYRNAYENYVESLRQQYGSNVNRDFLKMFQVSKQVISSLVTQKLLMQEAEKMNLRVTDLELANAIQSISSFQENGNFDNSRYTYLLEQNNLTTELFESSQRESMLIDKLSKLITSGIKISEGEIDDWYEWINAQVDLNYVVFKADDFKDIDPSEDELNSFYESNKENYQTEPKVKVRYMAFRPDQYKDKVELKDGDVEDYYDANLSDFQTEKTVEARHILLSVDDDATDDIIEEKRLKAEELAQMAREGKDFATLAKEYSEGATRETGGLLGEFKKEDMVTPFSDAAFEMDEGEISDPVRTQFGWHIIKVEKIHPATVSPMDEVKDEIKNALIKSYSEEYAYDRAMDAFDQALDDEDFQKTASNFGQVLLETDYFTASGPESGISEPGTFADAAFGLSGSDISDVLTIGDNFYIMQKTDEKESLIPPLEDVASQVEKDLISKMQSDEAYKKAQEFLVDIDSDGGMEAAASKRNVEILNTGFFKRSESIPNIGYVAEIIEAAFKLSPENKTPDTVFNASMGFCVVELKERKSPDMAELESQKDLITSQLLSQKQQLVFENWLTKLKSESEISIEDGYLD